MGGGWGVCGVCVCGLRVLGAGAQGEGSRERGRGNICLIDPFWPKYFFNQFVLAKNLCLIDPFWRCFARFLARLKKLQSFCWRLLRSVSGSGALAVLGCGRSGEGSRERGREEARAPPPLPTPHVHDQSVRPPAV